MSSQSEGVGWSRPMAVAGFAGGADVGRGRCKAFAARLWSGSRFVITDPSSGGLRLVLLANATTLSVGDLAVAPYFTPIPGQLSYSPNGAVGCAVLRVTASGWGVVDKTQLCDLSFASIQHASVAGTCDGTIGGQYHAVFSGNQVVLATRRQRRRPRDLILPNQASPCRSTPSGGPQCASGNLMPAYSNERIEERDSAPFEVARVAGDQSPT